MTRIDPQRMLALLREQLAGMHWHAERWRADHSPWQFVAAFCGFGDTILSQAIRRAVLRTDGEGLHRHFRKGGKSEFAVGRQVAPPIAHGCCGRSGLPLAQRRRMNASGAG
jgi:hypothetical protein